MGGDKFSEAWSSMESIRFEVYVTVNFHIIMWQVSEFWSVAVSFRNIVLPTYSKYNIEYKSILKKKHLIRHMGYHLSEYSIVTQ